MEYAKDNTWYKDGECKLLLSYDPAIPAPKLVVYSFTDIETWQKYNKQMELMNAIKIAHGPVDGGYQMIYKVNDIVIFLLEFPPGVNGVDRVYQVNLGHELTN
ncbi:MAG: hypothetical protein JWQ79_2497 [Mucilaginibacter sp.]|nr:hypothetical protein [Mucilaginibacter sp.]